VAPMQQPPPSPSSHLQIGFWQIRFLSTAKTIKHKFNFCLLPRLKLKNTFSFVQWILSICFPRNSKNKPTKKTLKTRKTNYSIVECDIIYNNNKHIHTRLQKKKPNNNNNSNAHNWKSST
jgi:hypothetical protein